MAQLKRYFVNNMLEVGKIDFNEQKQRTEAIVSKVIQNLVPSLQTFDGGLYVGIVGVSYMLYHLSKLSTFKELQAFYLELAEKDLKLALKEANHVMQSGRITDKTGFLTGNVGIFAVASVIFRRLGKLQESEQCLAKFKQSGEYLMELNWFQNGGDELFVGRAGYLCALLWLRDELCLEVIADDVAFQLLDTMIKSGKSYSASVKSAFPLMYHYYGTQYLGPAHGLAGILFVMLGFQTWITNRPEAENLIKICLDKLIQLQSIDGNFPCAMDEIGGGRRPIEDELIHWCHGAPGTIYLLARAYLNYRDQKYLTAALKCGELTWKKGLLKKGPGICHGIAGSGYVFLVLYQLTKDERHIKRAYQFMEFLYSPEFSKARTPDSPYSLYEGFAGTACFAGDLLHPDSASFPFFKI